MYSDFVDLHKDHKEYSNGIMELSMLLKNIADTHGNTIDNNNKLTKIFKDAINKNNNMATKLNKISDKYIKTGEIDDSVATDDNTSLLMELTYEYSDIGAELLLLIREDIADLNEILKDATITTVINKLSDLLN